MSSVKILKNNRYSTKKESRTTNSTVSHWLTTNGLVSIPADTHNNYILPIRLLTSGSAPNQSYSITVKKTHVLEQKNACYWNVPFCSSKTMTTCLISWMSDAGQRENVGFPGVQLSNDVHTHLLHRRIEVHHLVSDSQLVNKFLHTKQYSGVLKCCWHYNSML